METRRLQFGVAVVNNKLYVTGMSELKVQVIYEEGAQSRFWSEVSFFHKLLQALSLAGQVKWGKKNSFFQVSN